MEDLLKEIRTDLKEVKAEVLELVKQGAIHNQILYEHERRSTNLETRIIPIEDSHKFMRKLYMLSVGILGLTGSVIGIIKFFI